ncbi:hypothetical protein KY289_025091 [Solanum tuberosum]|uniref:Uncharacterized protein n=1 Tax=Solanum tuberosum TaxID=4113 RepID=M1DVB4_SOLTU|nr:hypothetical protein KY289_025091 [Solanum tuberosum]
MADLAAIQPSLQVGQSSPLTSEAFPPLIHPSSVSLSKDKSVKPKLPNVLMILPSDQLGKKENFAVVLKNLNHSSQYKKMVDPIPVKKMEYHNGIPRISWTGEEVERMNIIENL